MTGWLGTGGVLAPKRGTPVRRRTPLQKAAVAGPLFLMTAAQSARIAVLRGLLGVRHPHGWPLGEELLINMMRTLLTHGDVGVWRAFFRNVSKPEQTPRSVVVTRAERPGSRSLWFELRPELRPPAPSAKLALVFIHGGAFIAGSARQYQATYAVWLKQLAARGVDARVLSLHYPKAPEHPFPAARDSCEADIDWLLSGAAGVTGPVVVGGDSAGGNLALSSLAHLRDTGRLPRRPAGCLLVSPAVDLSSACVLCRNGPDAAAAGAHDYLPRDKLAQALPDAYAEDLADPYVSPTRLESFAGLVDGGFFVTSGGEELLCPDIRAFAKKLQAASRAGAGFTLRYLEEPGRVHSWPMLMQRHLLPRSGPIFDFLAAAAAGGAAGAPAGASE